MYNAVEILMTFVPFNLKGFCCSIANSCMAIAAPDVIRVWHTYKILYTDALKLIVISFQIPINIKGESVHGGLDHWNGLLDWTIQEKKACQFDTYECAEPMPPVLALAKHVLKFAMC